jgi:hypothetical protein
MNSDMIPAYFDYNIVTVKEKFTDIKMFVSVLMHFNYASDDVTDQYKNGSFCIIIIIIIKQKVELSL